MRISFLFDTMSPYTHLAYRALLRMEHKREWNIEQLSLVPMFLGGVMQGSGNKPPALVPNKGRWMIHDLERNAKMFNVPLLQSPTNFLSDVSKKILLVQRFLCGYQLYQFETEGRKFGHMNPASDSLKRLVLSFSKAIHEDGKYRDQDNNLEINEKFLIACATDAGLDPLAITKVLKLSQSDEAKNLLKSNTEFALNEGAFGSPMFIIQKDANSEPFYTFGSDRFEQIAFECGITPYPGIPRNESPTSSSKL